MGTKSAMILRRLAKHLLWLWELRRHRTRLRRLSFQSLGVNVRIEPGFEISYPEKIQIADDVYVGPHAYISGMGGVTIGPGTIIGPRVTIYSANHRFREATALPYNSEEVLQPVVIGENVWVGGNVIFVPGAQVGEGCVVGAGAVVTREFEPLTILGGNPAAEIGRRDADHYHRLKREGRVLLKMKRFPLAGPGLDHRDDLP
jgi:acetyltransferase-like isoleucine patch superfamily enzyme